MRNSQSLFTYLCFDRRPLTVELLFRFPGEVVITDVSAGTATDGSNTPADTDDDFFSSGTSPRSNVQATLPPAQEPHPL